MKHRTVSLQAQRKHSRRQFWKRAEEIFFWASAIPLAFVGAAAIVFFFVGVIDKCIHG